MKCLLAALSILPILSSGRDQRAIQLSIGKVQHSLKKLGTLTPNKPEKHPLSGDVFTRLDDDTVITIVNFFYSKPGPDAFFWVGESGSCGVDAIGKKSYPLAPGKVGTRNYDSPEQPILPEYDGTEKDVVLRLPEGVTVKDIKWLCIWCRKFQANFGEIEIKA
eukprot:TRINITY_DN9363_c0_g1_i1.p1 TRINITY_DN9363_c0_g1~~TRINITY_DN9363_c0_g1_i1.p1  ORF type:complete len:163 (-),score=37.73 TRINITY_DN9363_c0_g1_i1:153-641(-)